MKSYLELIRDRAAEVEIPDGSPDGSLELKTCAGLRLTLRGGVKEITGGPARRRWRLLRKERFRLAILQPFRGHFPLWRQK